MKVFTSSHLKKLESLYAEYGYKIRYEKGQFQSGACIVDAKNLIIVNTFLALDQKIEALLEIGKPILFDGEVLDKKNRSFVESLFKRMYAQL